MDKTEQTVIEKILGMTLRWLTPKEGRNSNAERECLQKFEYFLFGRKVIVERDNSPLKQNFKKRSRSPIKTPMLHPQLSKIRHSSQVYIFTNPSARAGYDTRSIFKRSLTGLNSEFSFSWTSCLTKAEEISLSYYLLIAGGWIIGFILFPRVLVLCEMQSVSSRIWTRVAVSISNGDNHYTTDTSSQV